MAKEKPIEKEKFARARLINKQAFKADSYEYDFRPNPNKTLSFHSVSTIPEVLALLEQDKSILVDGIALAATKDRKKIRPFRLTREKLFEAWKSHEKPGSFKLKESSFDEVPQYGGGQGGDTALVGQDYIPLMGGPFHKQQYLQDFTQAQMASFYAYHHDPIAHAIVHITRDFILGRGFRVDSKNKAAQAIWEAFARVNNLHTLMDQIAREISIYGETFVWKLPQNQTRISFNPEAGEQIPTGALPRVRLIDPSTCWDIIVPPEDVQKPLAYQLVFPTQYQIFTQDDATGKILPSMKFIFQQIPAEQVKHYKVNCVSNEKRGRSDIYPVLGYLKRLRDSVNYSVIAMQKATAWAIDTTIEGSDADVQAYVDSVNEMGSMPTAGSEFTHTSKVKREYLSNSASSNGGSDSAFEWCLNMICAGTQIPVSYLGTHLSGGSTRASALVATEPVAKKFEARQLILEQIIRDMWADLMDSLGIDAECEVTFPEIIVQDRSQKVKDLIIALDQEVISHERFAQIVSKEFNITDYDYQTEQDKIKAEREVESPWQKTLISPLTALPAAPVAQDSSSPSTSAVTKSERYDLTMGQGA